MLETDRRPAPDETRIDEIFEREFDQNMSVVEATARTIRSDFGATLAIMEERLRREENCFSLGTAAARRTLSTSPRNCWFVTSRIESRLPRSP